MKFDFSYKAASKVLFVIMVFCMIMMVYCGKQGQGFELSGSLGFSILLLIATHEWIICMCRK